MSVKHRVQRLEGKSDLSISGRERRELQLTANEIGVAPTVAIALTKAIRAGALPSGRGQA